MILHDKDAEEYAQRVTRYAREIANRFYFSPEQFKRLEWAVAMPGWSSLQGPKLYPAPKIKLPHEKLCSAQALLPPQPREAQEHGAMGIQWSRRKAKLNPPPGATEPPHERSRSEYHVKNKMSNYEAIAAMESLGHDFSGHEYKIRDILDEVRRDEWHDICGYYEH